MPPKARRSSLRVVAGLSSPRAPSALQTRRRGGQGPVHGAAGIDGPFGDFRKDKAHLKQVHRAEPSVPLDVVGSCLLQLIQIGLVRREVRRERVLAMLPSLPPVGYVPAGVYKV